MKTYEQIEYEFNNISECLLFVSKIYDKKLSKSIKSDAYFKAVNRMEKQHKIVRLAKGIYCIPKKTRFGNITPTEKEIVSFFTDNKNGVVIGYSLYNSLGLTTQISKNIHVLSSRITEKQRNINNIFIEKNSIVFNEKRKAAICMLDVLKNYSKIEDLNKKAFFSYCQKFANNFDELEMEYVIEKTSCPKHSIAFLREILNFFNTDNNISKFLSPFSDYKIPKMEDIYESAQNQRFSTPY